MDKTGTLAVPNTGGWQVWQTLTTTNVTLTAGKQVMRLSIDGGGSGGNMNFVNVVEESVTPTITVVSPNGGGNWSVGSTQNVIWNSVGVTGDVNIDLSVDGG